MSRSRSTTGSGIGTAERSEIVYGWKGRRRACRGRDLDDLAEVHDRDPVRDVADDREVVRDEEVRQLEVGLEGLEQVDDLGLDRDVERRDRLVADDEVRVERERAREPDALALAARELVRVARRRIRGKPDDLEQLTHAPRRSSFFPEMPWTRSGSPTMRPTLCRGFSDAYGSWKTICIRRRSGRRSFCERVVMSWPSKTILPPVGSYSRRMVRPTVDLPQPDSPTSPSVSPLWIEKLTSSTALMSPMCRSSRMPLLIGNQTLRFSISTSAPSPFLATSANHGRPGLLPFLGRHAG